MPYLYQCPKCGSPDHIDIDASVRVRLMQDDDGNFETDADAAEDNSHEWSQNSMACCTACYYAGFMETFVVKDAPPAYRTVQTLDGPAPSFCECGRDWQDCQTRDDPDGPHEDRRPQTEAPHRGIVAY